MILMLKKILEPAHRKRSEERKKFLDPELIANPPSAQNMMVHPLVEAIC